MPEQGNQTWEETTNILAGTISEHVDDVTPDEAYDMIERSHRSRPSTLRKGKRDILARFSDWRDSEYVKGKFLTASMKGKTRGIYIEPKYGPDTNYRRN